MHAYLQYFFLNTGEMYALSEILISLSIFVCVYRNTLKLEEDKTFWCDKYFVNLHEWTWHVCCAFLFFLSAHQTSPPTFTACALVSGESAVCVSAVASACSQLCSQGLLLCPCSSPRSREQDGVWGGGGIRGVEQARALSTSILTALTFQPVPKVSSKA